MIYRKDLINAFKDIDVVGKKVIVHSSLSSFGHVENGSKMVANVLTDNFKTVMVPAFCFDSVTKPPKGDWPEQNGCVIGYYEYREWNSTPYNVHKMGISKKVGVVSKEIMNMPNTTRSSHAWLSWGAHGKDALRYTEDHPDDDCLLPLKKISADGAWVLLMGVDLSACTAVHIAEENAGRKHFIRWYLDNKGNVSRIRAPGCGEGFQNLFPYVQHLINSIKLGQATLHAFEVKPFIDKVTEIIKENPRITRCDKKVCIRCEDSIKGGPFE